MEYLSKESDVTEHDYKQCMKYPFVSAQIITEYRVEKVNEAFMGIGRANPGERLAKMFGIFKTDRYNPNINSTLTGYFDSVFRVLLKYHPSEVLAVSLRPELLELLLQHFDDFSVMGILLKIVCVESQVLADMTGNSFTEERKALFFKILDKFLSVDSDPKGSLYESNGGELDLTKSICELMNGGAYFRYVIKDMNVIDPSIIGLIKDAKTFFEKALSPLFSVGFPH